MLGVELPEDGDKRIIHSLGKGLFGSASSPKSGCKSFAPTLNVRTALPHLGLAQGAAGACS